MSAISGSSQKMTGSYRLNTLSTGSVVPCRGYDCSPIWVSNAVLDIRMAYLWLLTTHMITINSLLASCRMKWMMLAKPLAHMILSVIT